MKKFKEFVKTHADELVVGSIIAAGLVGAVVCEIVRIRKQCSYDVINITIVMPKNQQK